MKEYDRVILIVNKEKYTKEGVHINMSGWICDSRNIEGQWLVCFDQYGELPNIATIPVSEIDLKVMSDDEIIAMNEAEELAAKKRLG